MVYYRHIDLYNFSLFRIIFTDMERLRHILKSKCKPDEEAEEDSTQPQKEGDKDKENETVAKGFTQPQKEGNKEGKYVKRAGDPFPTVAATVLTASGSARTKGPTEDKERHRFHKMMMMGRSDTVDSDDEDMTNVDPFKDRMYARFYDAMLRMGKDFDSSEDRERRRYKMKIRMMMKMMRGGADMDSSDDDDDDDVDTSMVAGILDNIMSQGRGSMCYSTSSARKDPYRGSRGRSYTNSMNKEKEQRMWTLPELVQPRLDREGSEDDASEEMQEEHGTIQTDAALYTLTVVSCQYAC